MLRPERPASSRLGPDTRNTSASTASMPSTAATPIQNSQRLRKARQSRPSGWISTEAAASGMVMRPSMRPPRRARCSSISSAETSPRAVLGGRAGMGATGVGAATSGIGAGRSPPVGACRSVVSGTCVVHAAAAAAHLRHHGLHGRVAARRRLRRALLRRGRHGRQGEEGEPGDATAVAARQPPAHVVTVSL